MSNGIQFKHYVVSSHALERFEERTGKPVEKFFDYLDRAVIFDPSRTKSMRWKHNYAAACQDGSYILKTGLIHFVVKPTNTGHVIKTVMVATPRKKRTGVAA